MVSMIGPTHNAWLWGTITNHKKSVCTYPNIFLEPPILMTQLGRVPRFCRSQHTVLRDYSNCIMITCTETDHHSGDWLDEVNGSISFTSYEQRFRGIRQSSSSRVSSNVLLH
jgi:hypothetical protein